MAAAVAAAEAGDRFGLGWRPELAAGILANRDRIDVVEIIAEEWFGGSRRRLRALETLAAQIPIVLHGVSLGLASTAPVDPARLDRMARLVAATGAAWSEHLAFVRAGGVEIGHLAAPPRSPASADGACENLERARRLVGTAPLVENIATLVMPPASTIDEAEWTGRIAAAADAGLLLDLHNLYANAVNFGDDPVALLRRFPLDRVRAVHLSGGRWIAGPDGNRRLLDDHLHDVPDPVLALLQEVGRIAPQKLTVILERDGHYPPMPHLLAQLDAARCALAAGRSKAGAGGGITPTQTLPHQGGGLVPGRRRALPLDGGGLGGGDARRLETFLACLYADEAALAAFLAGPEECARTAGLDPAVLATADKAGLVMAANSFRAKRAQRRQPRRFRWRMPHLGFPRSSTL